jgi:hypothetical protein
MKLSIDGQFRFRNEPHVPASCTVAEEVGFEDGTDEHEIGRDRKPPIQRNIRKRVAYFVVRESKYSS